MAEGRRVFHVTTDAEWSVAVDRGFHRPATFGDDGFVHASNADQVARTVRRFYADVPDLVVLEIDVARLDASCPVVDEPGDADSSELFPHLYGDVPVSAVTGVRAFRDRAP